MNKANFIKAKYIACLLVITAFVALFGYLLGAWSGFPKGHDAYARITRIIYILDFFPNVSWQYHWSNGMPTFQTEAPLFYFLGALIAKIFSLAPEKPLIIIGFLTFTFIGLGLFGYVSRLTKSLTAGLLAAILVLSSYSVWEWMVYGGIYPRIFGLSLSVMSFWLLIRFLQIAKKSTSLPKWSFFWLVLFLAATMVAHALMAFFAWIFIFFNLIWFPLTRRKKIEYGFLIYFVALCLAGFFYLPLILNFGGEVYHFLGLFSPVAPAPLHYLFEFVGAGPFLLPLLFIGLVLAFLKSKAQTAKESSFFLFLLAPLLMFTYFSVYALIGYTGLPGRYYYIGGFIPSSAILFMTLYGSILIGLSFGRLARTSKRVVPIINLVLVVLVISAAFLLGAPTINDNEYDYGPVDTSVGNKGSGVYALQQILEFPPEEDLNHRFSAVDASEAVWFSALYKIPQVRDYYSQGVLYPDWRYWHEQAVWNQEEFSLDEARVAFDWFATRWFSTYEIIIDTPRDLSVSEFSAQSKNRYLYEPGFKLITHGWIRLGVQAQFEIENPSPILSASNVPTILFIGDKAGYNLFFRNLTLVGLDSRRIIPLLGKRFIDDYKLSELTPFEIVILHNYRYHRKEKAYKILQDYVNQGGNLIWEVAGSPDIEGILPEPAPVTQVSQEEIKEKWTFQSSGETITSGVDFSSFSPFIYNDDFWKLYPVSTSDFRSWARGILGKGDQWIMVAGDYGEGKIIWTGFNFLYHINVNKNQEEAKFLARMINWLGAGEKVGPVDYQVKFISPEKRVVEIKEPAKGVLFKESYYPNWHAYLLDSKGKKDKLEIKLVGPAMMYVLLPEELSLPARVIFEYKLSLIEKLGILVSFLAFLFLLFYLVGRLSKPRFLSKFLKEVSGWWNKEEE